MLNWLGFPTARRPVAATTGDALLEQAGLVRHDGLPAHGACVVGSVKRRGKGTESLYDATDRLVGVFAPDRAGKTTCLVIPTLLTWRASAVVRDQHGEAYAHTAAWRSIEANNRIIRFEPGQAGTTDTYNPLAAIRFDGAHRTADAAHLAGLLLEGARHKIEPQLHQLATVYLTLVLLAEALSHGSLASAARNVAASNDSELGIWLDLQGDLKASIHAAYATEAAEHLARGADERWPGEVRRIALAVLEPFTDPVIGGNTHRSTFALEDLLNPAAPATLYLQARPFPAEQLVQRLLLSQLLERIVEREGMAAPLLLMLDDLPGLGRLSSLERHIGSLQSVGCKPYLVMASGSELVSIYGPESALLEELASSLVVTYGIRPGDDLARITGRTVVMGDDARSWERPALVCPPLPAEVVRVGLSPFYRDEPFRSRSR
ncbi:type IV secretory system conjugative DNA transfer family protein [Ideonella sp. DXS29W]|uniref:Type IV secretory system conjugative DNA transfer family protein n=1 Tax=Ideonella lacteola TaxID=2984193 RepID=A0ABU9BWA0_9BURK